MTTKDTGGAAFPHGEIPAHPQNIGAPPTPPYIGMTLRDWFAGMALQHVPLYRCHPPISDEERFTVYAKRAYLIADALIKARQT